MAVRNSPQASSAFDGITTRSPGICVKIDFAALAVIDRAAAADIRRSATRITMGALNPLLERQRSVASSSRNLHHGRPDVIEELNFDHRLQPARSQSGRASDDGRFGERGVETALGSELDLQSRGGLEHAALALHFRQTRFAAAIGHVFAEHDDARIARAFPRAASD